MINSNDALPLINIPDDEKDEFENIVKKYREKYIRKSDVLVDELFQEQPEYLKKIQEKQASVVITSAREGVWRKFLIEESEFNTYLLRDLSKSLKTPSSILQKLIESHIETKSGDELIESVKELCGEYAGEVYPYIYALSLSNTNSRRSRSGSTFQSVIYKIYDYLGYPYDSQKKVGRTIFDKVGLGKIVDSVLPGVSAFTSRRSMTIIGTMKTSLRERWQEVIEEIQRTMIPQIYLLTVDPAITINKSKQMNEHNITLVVPADLITEELKSMKNIISFEEYFFTDIPRMLEYWRSHE